MVLLDNKQRIYYTVKSVVKVQSLDGGCMDLMLLQIIRVLYS